MLVLEPDLTPGVEDVFHVLFNLRISSSDILDY